VADHTGNLSVSGISSAQPVKKIDKKRLALRFM